MNWDYISTIIKPMLEGAQTTIFLFLLAIVLSVPLGFAVTLAMRSQFKPLAWIAHTYVYVMRGTPLLLQVLFFCFGLPLLPVIGEYLVFDRFIAAAIAFILNYANFTLQKSFGADCCPLIKVSMRRPKCLDSRSGRP